MYLSVLPREVLLSTNVYAIENRTAGLNVIRAHSKRHQYVKIKIISMYVYKRHPTQ